MAALEDIRKNQLKKEDLSKEVRKVVSDVVDSKVGKKIDRMSKRQDKLEHRLNKLESRNESDSKGLGGLNASEDFLRARRSLRFSPCDPISDDLQAFLNTKMKIPEEISKNLKIINCRPVNPRSLPPNRRRTQAKNKVKVQFETIEDRDLVISYATNLGGSDGNVEIVIPDR